MPKFGFLLFLLLLAGLGSRAQTPAQANKRLFDNTVDELNFRTFETVYDKSFTRGKFPLTLRTAAARRSFDNFGDNAALKKLFMNYNGVAERYKSRFGNGPLTLAEFEKQLNSILRDRNFEFFIRNLPRDERVALIRAEQRLIKQATAQFNDSAAPESAAAAVAVESQAEAPLSAPLTTNGLDDAAAPAAAPDLADDNAVELPLTTRSQPASPAGTNTWVDYLTLLLCLANALILLYLMTSILPAMSRRINNLAYEPEPEPEPQSLMSRFRAARHPGALREDLYDDDEADPDDPQPRADGLDEYDDRDYDERA